MEGSGVNTYKLVNDKGEAVLCKFHWQPKQGVRNLTSAQASEIQAKDVGHATRDLYDNIQAVRITAMATTMRILVETGMAAALPRLRRCTERPR